MSNQKSFDDAQREEEQAEQEKRIRVNGSYIEIELDPDSSGLSRRITITVLKEGIEVYTSFNTGRTALLHDAANVFKVLNIH